MNKLYGVPYMGSKTKIALNILRQLPDGNRFCDLFGGGFAMSHAAMLTNKYNSVLYNDFNPLIVNLIQRAINGEFNYKQFKPEFITREEFNRRKDTDGYIKYIWSFGNGGDCYMFGKDVEPLKRSAHNFVVFGVWDGTLDKGFLNAVKSKDIHTRRVEFCTYAKANKKRFELEQLAQLERLERLEQLERLERLEITNMSYVDYNHRDGDVVYCDIPYEGATEYDGGFDHKAFYEWAASRDYAVYFSSYKISDKRFKIIWAKRKRITRGNDNSKANIECLYYNGK